MLCKGRRFLPRAAWPLRIDTFHWRIVVDRGEKPIGNLCRSAVWNSSADIANHALLFAVAVFVDRDTALMPAGSKAAGNP